MPFAVIFEFLISGIVTSLASLLFLTWLVGPAGTKEWMTWLADAQRIYVANDGARVVLCVVLLGLTYSVGVLANFMAYPIQIWLVAPICRKRVQVYYLSTKTDLGTILEERYGINLGRRHHCVPEWLWKINARFAGHLANARYLTELFGTMRTKVYIQNIDWYNRLSNYHDGLQRLSRGLIIPILFFIGAQIVHGPGEHLSVFVWTLLGLFAVLSSSCALLWHSVMAETRYGVRFFLMLEKEGKHQGSQKSHRGRHLDPISSG